MEREIHHDPSLSDWLQRVRGQQPALINETVERLLNWLPETATGELLEQLLLIELLGLDADCVAASMIEAGRVKGAVGSPAVVERVQSLADGLRRLAELDHARKLTPNRAGAEGLRRLLLALVKDIRVVLVKLCQQLVQLRRAAKADGEVRRTLARETSVIYAPLANRLGIWQLKWELEDLSFRYLEPETYQRIAKMLDQRRADRERYIQQVIKILGDALKKAGIDAEIAGRPKHIYSIWRKMQRKDVGFDDLFDIRAARVLVDSIAECYGTLGVVHGLWQHIPREFDDYIATPKANHYQSLHTAVAGPGGRAVEIQIRTREMHEQSERGVAAHWVYKEGGGRDPQFERKILSIRQLLESRESGEQDDVLDDFSTDLGEDRVYSLTPAGEVIDMPKGATVLDFAYHVHTMVGHRCRGAKINGRIVPLTRCVGTGDQVEILTGKTARPSRDWLSPHSGYLYCARSRQKARQWFRQLDRDANREAGREAIERELKQMNLAHVDVDKVLPRFNLKAVEALEIAVGIGEITPMQVARAADEVLHPGSRRSRAPRPAPPLVESGSGGVVIEGVGDLLTRLAPCCKPLPGDEIIGYITRGRGVTVHRRDCGNVGNLLNEESPRLIEVAWGSTDDNSYPVDIRIEALNRKLLLQDVSTVLADARLPLLSMNSQLDEGSARTLMTATVRISDIEQLSNLFNKISTIPNVESVSRIQPGQRRRGSRAQQHSGRKT